MGFPSGSDGKEFTCNVRDLGSIPGLERSLRERKVYSLQYFCLEISMDEEPGKLQSMGWQRVGLLSVFHQTNTQLALCICRFHILRFNQPWMEKNSRKFRKAILNLPHTGNYLQAFILYQILQVIFSSVQSFSRVQIFATPWTVACQVSLSITNSQSLLKLMSLELVMPSNHLILCRPLLLLPSIFPSIRVFSSESVLRIRWPQFQVLKFQLQHQFQ